MFCPKRILLLCTVFVMGACVNRSYNTDSIAQDFSTTQDATVFVFWTEPGKDLVFRAPCKDAFAPSRTSCSGNGIIQTKKANFRKHLANTLKVKDSVDLKELLENLNGKISSLVSQNQKIELELANSSADSATATTLKLQLKDNESDIRSVQQSIDSLIDTALDKNEVAKRIFSQLDSEIVIDLNKPSQENNPATVVFNTFKDDQIVVPPVSEPSGPVKTLFSVVNCNDKTDKVVNVGPEPFNYKQFVATSCPLTDEEIQTLNQEQGEVLKPGSFCYFKSANLSDGTNSMNRLISNFTNATLLSTMVGQERFIGISLNMTKHSVLSLAVKRCCVGARNPDAQCTRILDSNFKLTLTK